MTSQLMQNKDCHSLFDAGAQPPRGTRGTRPPCALPCPPYIKMTTDSLSSELTFDEWRGVILQRIIRPTLLLRVITHLLFLTTLRSGALICYHRRPISLLVPQSRKRGYAPALMTVSMACINRKRWMHRTHQFCRHFDNNFGKLWGI